MEEPLLRILIIDDDEVDRMLIVRSLKKAGIKAHIHQAEDISEAWEALGSETFHCIFIDYLLPGGDGVNMLKELREQGYRIPIIVVTSQGDEKIAVEAMKAGASDYLSKRLMNPEGVSLIMRTAIRTQLAEEENLRAQKALQESETRLAEAQRIARIGNWWLKVQDNTVFWSDQLYEIMGVKRENFSPGIESILPLIHPEDQDKVKGAMYKCALEFTPYTMDARVLRNGELRYVEFQGRPEFVRPQEIGRLIGTVQDITERKVIEQELIHARDAAEQSAKAKQEFLANMSHEIRTPMNAILGFARLMEKTPMNPEQKEFLQSINVAGEGLITIINDILDLSKIEAGKLSFEEKDFNLSELFSSLEGMFRAKISEKGLNLDSEIEREVPEVIIGDPGRLNQVLINLISNAIKFTERGSVRFSAQVLSSKDDAYRLRFEVRDSGIGIPEDKLQNIFDSFTQASSSTTRKYGGTGLGLTICKRIVELQDGKIGVESHENKGSMFFFELPFQKAQAVSSQEDSQSDEGQHSDRDLSQYRILLAEDNRLNQVLARKVLQSLGFVSDLAVNGQEVLKMLEVNPYDLILMDIQMPELDGLAATRIIREEGDPAWKDIPIMAMTAHAIAEEVERCHNAGMNDFISKPFNPDDLFQKMIGLLPPENEAEEEAGPPENPFIWIDPKEVDELAEGDKAFKLELIDIFFQTVPEAMKKMQIAVREQDWEALYQTEHGAKPSFYLFGIRDSAELIEGIESRIKAKKGYDEIPQLLDTLESHLHNALEELEALRKDLL